MFNVVIPRDEISYVPDHRGFENAIVIGITADREGSGERNQRGTSGDQLAVLGDVCFGNAVCSLDTRSSQDILYFSQQRKRCHHVDPAGQPGVSQLGWCTDRVEERRDPDVGIKQRGGLHVVWLGLRRVLR